MNRRGVTAARVLSVLACLGVLAGSVQAQDNKKANANTNPPPKLVIQEAPLSREVKLATSIAPMVKKVAPSVVNIYTSTTIKERSGGFHPFLNDPLFRRFFGEEFGQQMPRERKAQSLGSGVIVSPNGYILTANHVVEDADVVKVAVGNGGGETEYEARVIGTDPPTDIAVLKIDAKTNLPAITLTDSEKLEVGDLVIAIGNPFGVGQTVTVGIISALGRGGFNITGYENFIQTDAAINPGNSGGALVDAEGRLVGINTAILSRSGGFQGVGFAVPINMARYVMERITNEGKVRRGYLGISLQPLTPSLAKGLGLPAESSGVIVGGVQPASAAEKAGFKDGDLITEVNGKKVADPRNLQLIVAQISPGTKINVKVLRGDGKKASEKTLSAILGELPSDMFGGPSDSAKEAPEGEDVLDGVEVTDLDSQVRRQFGIPANIRGALVTNVDPNSNAAEGLRPGDVILEINRQPVKNAEDAIRLSKGLKNDRVLLRVWSGGAGPGGITRYVVIENSKNP
jgi:serine protease Do